MNNPHLYISYREDKKEIKIGPFFSATLDGVDVLGYKFMCYRVVDQNGNWKRLTVPWYHSLEAMTYNYNRE